MFNSVQHSLVLLKASPVRAPFDRFCATGEYELRRQFGADAGLTPVEIVLCRTSGPVFVQCVHAIVPEHVQDLVGVVPSVMPVGFEFSELDRLLKWIDSTGAYLVVDFSLDLEVRGWIKT